MMASGARRIRDYVRRYRGEFALGFVALVLTNVFALTIPWLLKLAVDALAGAEPGAIRTARWLAVAIAGAAVMMGAIRTLSRIWIFGAGRRVEFDLRNELFEHLSRMPPGWFHRHSVGDVMSRAVNDLTQVRLLLGPGLLNIVNTAVAYGVGITLMVIIDPWLTLMALIPYPLLLLWVRLFAGRLYRRSRAVQDKLGELSTDLQENLAGQQVLKAYGREPASIAAFAARNEEYLGLSLRLALTRGLMVPVFGLVGGVGTLVVLWLGGRAVIDGRISLGALVAFNGYLAILAWPTIALGWILSVWQRGMSAMARLNEIFSAVPGIVDEGQEEPETLHGRIEIRDLTFRHEDAETPALQGLSIEVPAGSRLGIVGATGSGKSTLVDLLPRLKPVPKGTIFIDGIDVNDMPLRILRGAIGYAPQDPFLFSATLHDNIAFARPDATREEVREAARLAALDDDVTAFPRGYETLVGERGVTLSGGQRQRVALARALLKDPRILVLDDSLSSVDAETESRILAGLEEVVGGRTSIIVSHRIAAVQRCDRIIVLEAGRIIASGTHDALVAAGGLYADLWRRQRLEAEIEADEAPMRLEPAAEAGDGR
jgi:ATP-binding cassette, subfamily B, multidrug efflux pump